MAGLMAEGDYKKQAGLYTGFVDKWLQNFWEAAGKAGGAVRVTKAFYVFVRPAEKRGGGAAVFEVSREELYAAIKGLLGE